MGAAAELAAVDGVLKVGVDVGAEVAVEAGVGKVAVAAGVAEAAKVDEGQRTQWPQRPGGRRVRGGHSGVVIEVAQVRNKSRRMVVVEVVVGW